MSFNLGVQRELPGSIIADVSYVGTLARNLNWRTINLNQLRPGTRLNAPQSTMNVNALRPFLGYGNINMNENGDSSNYNSLQVALNRRRASGLSFGVNYTFSRTLDTSSGTPQNAYDARAGLRALRHSPQARPQLQLRLRAALLPAAPHARWCGIPWAAGSSPASPASRAERR